MSSLTPSSRRRAYKMLHDLGRAFDLFAQGERSIDRAQGGLGLGLTLVKRLVGLHRGSVTARSEGIGRGSTFTLRLPLAGEVAATSLPMPTSCEP